MKYDLVATLGIYEKDGQKKYISRNVGTLMETDKGWSVKLDATFNPAGCVRKEDGGVWLTAFEQKPKEAKQSNERAPDDECPF